MTEKHSSYLALDPGLTTGWAEFDDLGSLMGFGQVKEKDLTDFLTDHLHSDLKEVICEDYRNHGWMQQKKWGRNETSKIIGKIELLAELKNVPFVLQPNTVKSIGYMWGGITAPSNHSISHQYDAYAHGCYRLQTTGVRKPGQGLNLGTV